MCVSAPPPPPPCRLRRYRRLQEQLLLLSGGQIWATGVLWRLSTHISLSQTNKHFSSYCKVFSAATTSRGPGDSQSRSIIFPNLLKKFLEKFCCPLFFIHRSIFQSIPLSLGFFFPDRGRFCVFSAFDVIHSQVDALFLCFVFLIANNCCIAVVWRLSWNSFYD